MTVELRYLAGCLLVVSGIVTVLPGNAIADGIVVDRIYEPYVQPLEKELEWRSLLQYGDREPDRQKHLLGLGRSVSERWALEFYLVATDDGGDSFDLDLYELEVRRQLTEQGEYAVDWGVVFELEREVDDNIWEAAASMLAARDFGRWTGLASLGVAFEWGAGIDNEIESELRLQMRYRYSEGLEPALELHKGQDTFVLGPALTGLYRLSPGRKLRWNTGIFLGLDSASPDIVARVGLEYEF